MIILKVTICGAVVSYTGCSHYFIQIMYLQQIREIIKTAAPLILFIKLSSCPVGENDRFYLQVWGMLVLY